MRNKTLITVILVALGAMAFLFPLRDASSQTREDPQPQVLEPVRWDYMTRSLFHDLIQRGGPLQDSRLSYEQIERSLDRLGQDGWQLVHASDDLFIFARPIFTAEAR